MSSSPSSLFFFLLWSNFHVLDHLLLLYSRTEICLHSRTSVSVIKPNQRRGFVYLSLPIPLTATPSRKTPNFLATWLPLAFLQSTMIGTENWISGHCSFHETGYWGMAVSHSFIHLRMLCEAIRIHSKDDRIDCSQTKDVHETIDISQMAAKALLCSKKA